MRFILVRQSLYIKGHLVQLLEIDGEGDRLVGAAVLQGGRLPPPGSHIKSRFQIRRSENRLYVAFEELIAFGIRWDPIFVSRYWLFVRTLMYFYF
jgi:hypothetical protein